MQDIIETEDDCQGIASHNDKLYLLINKWDNETKTCNQVTYLLQDKNLILSKENINFNNYIPHVNGNISKEDELYNTWTWNDNECGVFLHYQDKIISMEGTPYFFITKHKEYIYACGGIGGLWLRRIKIE